MPLHLWGYTGKRAQYVLWASCQIRKIAGAHALGIPGSFSFPSQVSDPDMHHGTCVTHVPWCMPGSLTSSFLWSRRRGKMFPAYPDVSGKKPIKETQVCCDCLFLVCHNLWRIHVIIFRAFSLALRKWNILMLFDYPSVSHAHTHSLLWVYFCEIFWTYWGQDGRNSRNLAWDSFVGIFLVIVL